MQNFSRFGFVALSGSRSVCAGFPLSGIYFGINPDYPGEDFPSTCIIGKCRTSVTERPKSPLSNTKCTNDTVGNESCATYIIGGRLHVRSLANDTFGHLFNILLPHLSFFSHHFPATCIIREPLQNYRPEDETSRNFIEPSYLHRWRACAR